MNLDHETVVQQITDAFENDPDPYHRHERALYSIDEVKNLLKSTQVSDENIKKYWDSDALFEVKSPFFSLRT